MQKHVTVILNPSKYLVTWVLRQASREVSPLEVSPGSEISSAEKASLFSGQINHGITSMPLQRPSSASNLFSWHVCQL